MDIVLDCLCGEECNRGYNLLKPMGKYVLFGSSNVVTGETKSFFSVARSVSRFELIWLALITNTFLCYFTVVASRQSITYQIV